MHHVETRYESSVFSFSAVHGTYMEQAVARIIRAPRWCDCHGSTMGRLGPSVVPHMRDTVGHPAPWPLWPYDLNLLPVDLGSLWAGDRHGFCFRFCFASTKLYKII